MFDIGWSEMAIIMLVALVVIGPKDLPRMARTLGQWVAKGRAMAREFQRSLEDMAREAELDDVKREIEKVGSTNIKKSIEKTIDPKGELSSAFDPESKTKKPANAGAPMANGAAGEPATAKPAATVEPKPTEPQKAEAPKPESPKAEAKTGTTEPKPTKPAVGAGTEGAAKPKPRTRKTTAGAKAAAKPRAAAKPKTTTGTAPKPASSEKKAKAETMAEPH